MFVESEVAYPRGKKKKSHATKGVHIDIESNFVIKENLTT